MNLPGYDRWLDAPYQRDMDARAADVPEADENEEDADPTCHVCGKPPLFQADGRAVEPCDNCERLVCSECVECDYDMQGDPGHYVCTQWICPSGGGCRKAVA